MILARRVGHHEELFDHTVRCSISRHAIEIGASCVTKPSLCRGDGRHCQSDEALELHLPMPM